MTESVASTRSFEGLQIPVAGTYVLDAAHKRVGFVARHLMVSKVRGQFAEASATITIGEDPLESSVSASIVAASIETGQVDRDNHLRSGDFFAVDKHPTITFTSSKVTKKSAELYDVEGTLTIRNTAKQVTLPVTYLGSAQDPWGNARVGFETAITINRKDFGLNWNAALEAGGFLVGDDVKISVSVQAIGA